MSSWMNGIYFFFCLRRVQLLITMEHRSKPALFEAKWKRPVGFTSRIRLTLVFMSGRVEQISGTISVGSGWRVSSSESLIWGGSATSCLHLAIGVTWTRCVNWKADCDGPIEEFLEVTVSGDVTNPLKKKTSDVEIFWLRPERFWWLLKAKRRETTKNVCGDGDEHVITRKRFGERRNGWGVLRMLRNLRTRWSRWTFDDTAERTVDHFRFEGEWISIRLQVFIANHHYSTIMCVCV